MSLLGVQNINGGNKTSRTKMEGMKPRKTYGGGKAPVKFPEENKKEQAIYEYMNAATKRSYEYI